MIPKKFIYELITDTYVHTTEQVSSEIFLTIWYRLLKIHRHQVNSPTAAFDQEVNRTPESESYLCHTYYYEEIYFLLARLVEKSLKLSKRWWLELL